MMTTWIKARVVIFGLLLVVLAFLVGRRAVQLQVREAAQLREWAQNNYLSEIQIPSATWAHSRSPGQRAGFHRRARFGIRQSAPA